MGRSRAVRDAARRAAASLALFWLAASPAAAADDAGCTIGLERANPDGVDSYAAECHWPVAPELVASIVGDPSTFAEVSSSLAASTRLGDGRILNVISPGWPLDDRQSTLRIEKEPLPHGGLRLVYSLAPVQEPLGRGRVQTQRDDGRWEIRADGRGGSHVRYETTYDAGGNLPRAVVQGAIPRHMAKSMRELRSAAEARAQSAAR
jgi:hypothetical protein